MTEDIDAKTRAANIIRQIIADDGSTVDMKDPAAAAIITSLIEAVEVDLITADHLKAQHPDAEERLQKVEAQTRVLSEAVVAIAAPGIARRPRHQSRQGRDEDALSHQRQAGCASTQGELYEYYERPGMLNVYVATFPPG